MAKILLLYDTKEKDLARDVSDFLSELGCTVVMIPRAPDLGKTLQEKESHYFNETEGVVFLITHGADRGDAKLPSPSVADELGQAKTLFAKEPHRIVSLVDKDCDLQAIDQRAYISFDRTDMRSILDAFTRLIVNLKAAGLVTLGTQTMGPATATAPVPVPQASPAKKGIDPAEVAAKLDPVMASICEAMSHEPNGLTNYLAFHNILKKHRLDGQGANFAKRDLDAQELIKYSKGTPPLNMALYFLTPLGWEVVRVLKQKKSSALGQNLIDALLPKPAEPLSAQAQLALLRDAARKKRTGR